MRNLSVGRDALLHHPDETTPRSVGGKGGHGRHNWRGLDYIDLLVANSRLPDMRISWWDFHGQRHAGGDCD